MRRPTAQHHQGTSSGGRVPQAVVADPAICLGISSCLLGERVRYDGKDKRDSYIAGTLGRYFTFVSVCPEVAIGLGVPRPPIQLVGDRQQPHAIGVHDPTLDVTEALRAFGRKTGAELANISGYLFKRGSPSCGMKRVPVHKGNRCTGYGVGLYAWELMRARPLLPVEEEGRLGEPALRDNFLERVFAFHRWQTCVQSGVTVAALRKFHYAHRLALMAHGPQRCRALDSLIATGGRVDSQRLAQRYIALFMDALKHLATPRRHSRVFRHLLSYLRPHLSREDEQELLGAMDAYCRGCVPRTVPLTLLRHHFRRHPGLNADKQLYLNPPCAEFVLRNTV